jgi:magnesium transporter
VTLKEFKDKMLSGDLNSLLHPNAQKEIHPSEVAKILDAIPAENAVQSFSAFSERKRVVIFPYLGFLLQKVLGESLPPGEVSYILNRLDSTDRYSFFSSLEEEERPQFLRLLTEVNRKAAQDILGYSKQSVARLVNTEFTPVKQNMTLSEASLHLRQFHLDSDTANVVYVVDDRNTLLDDVPIRRLVLNDPAKRISDIMDGECVRLHINDSVDDAIAKFKQYDRTVLPVVSLENKLIGVVTVDDVIDVAEQKNTREMQKFGGLESLEYPYVNTPVFSLIQKRAGWLIILFLSEMLTATAMGYFENEIAKAVVLALFVPLVISSGGNSGSQAATLIIRAMAVKELGVKDWWYVMKREIFSGLCLGSILGSIGFLRITAWQKFGWYNYGPHWMLMATTIFFSLIGIILWGTLSGSMIPMVLKKFKLDPATSSAPFVATLVDVTGLVIYFSIAALLLKGTYL